MEDSRSRLRETTQTFRRVRATYKGPYGLEPVIILWDKAMPLRHLIALQRVSKQQIMVQRTGASRRGRKLHLSVELKDLIMDPAELAEDECRTYPIAASLERGMAKLPSI